MKRILFLFLFSCICIVWGFAQANLQTAAIVNLTRSEAISVGQLRTEVERMERGAGRSLTEQERRHVLDVMINERLVLQAAERDRITVSDNDVNGQISQLRMQMAQRIGRALTDAEFATAIRNETGLEEPAFREQLRRQLITQAFLMAKKGDDMRSRIRIPTESEIRAEFNLARAQFVRPETVFFKMIQIPYGQNAASRTEARRRADQILQRIGSSSSRFDQEVTAGQAPNSGYQAGDGGYLPRTREAQALFGPTFMEAAFSLRAGEISRVIEGTVGFQIIMITETHAQKMLDLDDEVQLGTRVTVRDFIGNAMLEERQQPVIAQAVEELAAELRAGRNFQVFDRNLNW